VRYGFAAGASIIAAVVLLGLLRGWPPAAIFCGLAIAISALAYFGPAATAAVWDREIKDAGDLLSRRQPDKALELCHQYMKRNPHNPEAWYLSTWALMSLGRFGDLVPFADRAIVLNAPIETRLMRGIAFYFLGLHDNACDDFSELDLQNKLPSQARMCFGAALVSLRRLDAAVDVLKEAARLGVGRETSLHLGEAYRLLRRPAEAQAAYTTAAQSAYRMAGDKPECQGLLAYCLARLGQWDNAEAVARFVLSTAGQNTVALGTLVLVGLARDSRDQTYTALEQLLAARPSGALGALLDVDLTPLLAEKRFRELLAWALGAQRQARERVLAQRNTAPLGTFQR